MFEEVTKEMERMEILEVLSEVKRGIGFLYSNQFILRDVQQLHVY